jgi:Holliday junction resolvase RusA-like endonuclease
METDEYTLVKFFVEGEPRPKQSFRVAGRGRGYTPARVKAWQTDVACDAYRAMRMIGRFSQPFETDMLAVRLIFFLGNNRRVDLDNLSKAVLDGLNGICYGDDRQIADLHLSKLIVANTNQKPGVNVFVRAYQQKEG